MTQIRRIMAVGSVALTCWAGAALGNDGDVARRMIERHGDALRPSDLGSADEIDLVGRLVVKVEPSVRERLRTAPRGSEERRTAVRTIGRAFLDTDGHLLAGPDESWQERLIDTGDPTSAIRYDRYVHGIRTEHALLTLVIDNQTGEIRRVYATKFESSPALVEAVAAPHLTEEQVGEIIKPDLGPKPYVNPATYRNQATSEGGARLGTFEKVVVAEPPYVVWIVDTRHSLYRVDALTGAVLKKEPQPRGFNPE